MQSQSIKSTHREFAPAQDVVTMAADDQVKFIGVARTFQRGQEIFGEGEPPDLVYKVAAGSVRCFHLLSDGRRQISSFYFAGDVFGVELGSRRHATAEALTDAAIVTARRTAVAADPGQMDRLWRHAMCELRRCEDHVLMLGRRAANERVVSFLLDLAERLGAGPDFELPMSRQDIADYLGLTIETVSRTLTQLQAEGLIKLSGYRRVRLARPTSLLQLCE